MKGKREHLVPLCRRAVQLLEATQALHEGGELVFPSPHGHVIAYRAFYQILQDHWSAAVLARRGLAGRSRRGDPGRRIVHVKGTYRPSIVCTPADAGPADRPAEHGLASRSRAWHATS